MKILKHNPQVSAGQRKYSIPYNGDLDLVRWAVKTGHVYEVYFAGGAGHDLSTVASRDSVYSSNEIEKLVAFCSAQGIGRNLLINKSVLYFENVKRLLAYIRSLERAGGVTAVTVADQRIVPYLSRAFPEVEIQASVFMHIDSALKAREAWRNGIKSLCLDVSLNRNIPELERIRELKRYYKELRVKLLVNHGCYCNCVHSGRHEDWLVFRDLMKRQGRKGRHALGALFDSEPCAFRRTSWVDEIKRPFIRPEDVCFYENNGLADHFKIAYRNDSSEELRVKLSAYFLRSFDGDIFRLAPSNYRDDAEFICSNKDIPKNFVTMTGRCGYACETCHYCDEVATRAFKPNLSGHQRRRKDNIA
ncbi:MAG: hypothetical protein HGA80_03960 [Candidatus Omnitrophica bacterium]|nr:hypothetical protein [Candidatus Omnitrophota bacterium]